MSCCLLAHTHAHAPASCPSCLMVPFSVAVGRRPRIHPVDSRPTAACVRPRFVCRCHIFGECPLTPLARSPKDCDGLSRFISTTRHFPASLAAAAAVVSFWADGRGCSNPRKSAPAPHWGQITSYAHREILKPETETPAAFLRNAPGRKGGFVHVASQVDEHLAIFPSNNKAIQTNRRERRGPRSKLSDSGHNFSCLHSTKPVDFWPTPFRPVRERERFARSVADLCTRMTRRAGFWSGSTSDVAGGSSD